MDIMGGKFGFVFVVQAFDVAAALAQVHCVESPQPSKAQLSGGLVVSGSVDGHDYVDLGLSVKWATCNIGASTPRDYGKYYGWGETTTKTDYSYDNHKWCGQSYSNLQSKRIIDKNGDLMPQYDTARQNWGKAWRMPTADEVEELINKCTWAWEMVDGHDGVRVTGRNGNSIFLPAAGSRFFTNLLSDGSSGYYWCATAFDNCYYAYSLNFYLDNCRLFYYDRNDGYTIRPVTKQ